MRKAILAALLGTLVVSNTAQAIVVTLDEYVVTAVQPVSGRANAFWTGTIELTPGYQIVQFTSSPLLNASGDPVWGVFALVRRVALLEE